MSLNTYPLITWGTAEDLTAWSQVNTCSVTGSQNDPFSGTSAYLLSDGSAATIGERARSYTATYAGWHTFAVFLKQYGSDPATLIVIGNSTLSYQGAALITWTAGIPTVADGGSTNGYYTQPALLHSGWYRFSVRTLAVAGNTMQTWIRPSSGTVTDQTSVYAHVQNHVLLDLLDHPVAWEEPRDGSAWAQSGSGSEDAWIQGTDYRFSAEVPWVPTVDQSTPAVVSGWGLPLEVTGVNCGVGAMLRAGRNKETLTFYRNREMTYNAVNERVASLLIAPLRDSPALQPNGNRRFTLELRNASKPYMGFDET